MYCTCRISGYMWALPDSISLKASCEHPIFALSERQLITLWEQSGITRKLSKDEIKLLCLALLLKTGLVIQGNASAQWEAFNFSTAIKCVMPLIGVLNTLRNNPALSAILPRYKIRHFSALDSITADMNNLRDVITIWQEEISEYQTGYRARHKLTIERIDALTRLIMCGTKPIKAARHLAIYIADNIGFPAKPVGTTKGIMTLREYWIGLIVLCAKVTKTDSFDVLLYGTELEDLELLLSYIIDHSGQGDIFIYHAIGLIKAGIASYKEVFTPILLDSSALSKSGQLIAASIAESLANASAANISNAKPVKSEFKSLVDYFKALSAWQLQNKIG